jgi:hypothetical protein
MVVGGGSGTGATEQETERRGHDEEQEEPRVYHIVLFRVLLLVSEVSPFSHPNSKERVG